jgi:hypothetical protein
LAELAWDSATAKARRESPTDRNGILKLCGKLRTSPLALETQDLRAAA